MWVYASTKSLCGVVGILLAALKQYYGPKYKVSSFSFFLIKQNQPLQVSKTNSNFQF